MSVLILLRLRLLLLARPRASTRSRGRAGNGRGRLLLRVGVIAVVALGLAVSLGNLLGGVVDGPAGRLLLVPAFAWLSSTASLLLFLASVPVALAAFTYNSDLKLLLLAPLSPRVVLGEKVLALLGSVALPLLTVGLVIVLLIGRALGLGLGYDLAAVVALVLLPAAPLALAVLLTVAVLRWVPPARARTITAVLGALFGIAIYLGSRLLSGNAARSSLSSLQAALHGSNRAWWSTLPTTWPGRALAAAGLGQAGTALAYLAATAVLAALLLGLAIALAAHLFATGWATYQEVGRRRVAPGRPRQRTRGSASRPCCGPERGVCPATSDDGRAGRDLAAAAGEGVAHPAPRHAGVVAPDLSPVRAGLRALPGARRPLLRGAGRGARGHGHLGGHARLLHARRAGAPHYQPRRALALPARAGAAARPRYPVRQVGLLRGAGAAGRGDSSWSPGAPSWVSRPARRCWPTAPSPR